jgi:hypothetical protein
LDRLAEGAWKVNHKQYRCMGGRSAKDILYSPATVEIRAAEKVGELPADDQDCQWVSVSAAHNSLDRNESDKMIASKEAGTYSAAA